MGEYLKKILAGQFEAALCMLNHCVQACPPERWEGKIANLSFRQVAYHTLFFVDAYLSPNQEAFQMRELNRRGGDERQPKPTPGLSKEETLQYLDICRRKATEALGAETRESLEGPSGFPRRKISRGELHIYNIRHVQHHTGQLSAFLRRIDRLREKEEALPWVGTGWQ
jgi:uncharacterized damage-inducible protein DinB